MTDPITLGLASTSVGLVNGLISLLKEARDAAKGSDDHDLKAKLSEVFDAVLELKEVLGNLREENTELRSQIERSRSYGQHHSAIWKTRTDGTEDGPFCPACMGEDREMRLVLLDRVGQVGGFWRTHCPTNHIDHRDKTPKGWNPGAQEQTYFIPKDLVPENYFFHPSTNSSVTG